MSKRIYRLWIASTCVALCAATGQTRGIAPSAGPAPSLFADRLSDGTCGNGIVDPGEECDDGNNDDGDGCRGDCLIEGACCEVTPGAADCGVVIEADCVATGGRFLGPATDCAGFHCSCEPITLLPLASTDPQPGRIRPQVAAGGNTLAATVTDLSHTLEKIAVFDRSAVDQDDWTQTTVLDAPGRRRIAIDSSGDTLVASATLEGDGTFVYLFERDPATGDWDDGIKLFAHDPEGQAQLASAVDIDGNRIVAGGSSSVYVFERNAGGWTQVDRLEVEGSFGNAVAVGGEVIAAEARFDDDGAHNAGAAAIFVRSAADDGSGSWNQVARLYSPVGTPGGQFGLSLALDPVGDFVVAGAPREGPVYEAGAAYVFGRNTGGSEAWGLVAVLKSPAPKVEDFFGISVAMDAGRIVVGAVDGGEGGAGILFAGAAYAFTRNSRGPDSWGQVAKQRAPVRNDGDYFGRYVAVSGDTFVIGTLQHNVAYTGRLACSDCSDGLPGLFEICDDGNAVDGDGCSAYCEPGCGTRVNRFAQPVLALDKTTFGWALPVDASYARGTLGFGDSYNVLETGSLPSSTSLAEVPDPPPGSGFFLLLGVDCPISTWSSGGSGECSAASCNRDAQLPLP